MEMKIWGCAMGSVLAMLAWRPDPPPTLPTANMPLHRELPLVDSMLRHCRGAYCTDRLLLSRAYPLLLRTHNSQDDIDATEDSLHSLRVVAREDSWAVISFDQGLQRIVVSFRGTSDKLSWVRNFDIVTTSPWEEDSHVQVHAGFWASYERIGPELREEIAEVVSETGSCRLISTGHSLGGAMGILFFSDIMRRPISHPLCDEGLSLDGSFSFGSPRVGNRAFADWYNRLGIPTWTVTHSTDMIPRLPVRFPPIVRSQVEWMHVGSLHAFSNSSCSHYIGVCSPGDSLCEDSTLPGDVSGTLYSTLSTPSQHVVYFGSKLTRRGCQVQASWMDRLVVSFEWAILCLVIVVRVMLHVAP